MKDIGVQSALRRNSILRLQQGTDRIILKVKIFGLILIIGFSAGLLPRMIQAQTIGTGSIQGTVTDQQAAVVPNATVTAEDPATGRTASSHSSSAGTYVLPALAPANYRVTVHSSGFENLIHDNVTVSALATVTLDLALRIGKDTETVEVTSLPPQLDTVNGTLDTTISNDTYTALPLSMSGAPKSPLGFVSLTPGTSAGGNNTIDLNGGPGQSSLLYMNGMPVTTAELQGDPKDINFDTSVEIVDQFEIIDSGVPAYYTGQGVINFVLKSGTNKFHGDVYENVRNTAFDAAGYFSATTPVEHQNEYGASIGGPILKNRLFFFFNLDRFEYVAGLNPIYTTIPTLAERTGDFSALPVSIYDPATTSCVGAVCHRQAFPGNIIPASRISSISAALQSYLPAPVNSNLQNNYIHAISLGNHQPVYEGKADYRLTKSNHLSFLAESGVYNNGFPLQETLPLPYTVSRRTIDTAHLTQIGDTQTFGQNLVNVFGYQVNRYVVQQINPTTNLGEGAAHAGITGIPGGQASENFPSLSFAGPNSEAAWATIGSTSSFRRFNTTNTFQDNLQWVHGKHNVTFGGQVIFQTENQILPSFLNGIAFSNNEVAGFNAAGTIISTTGNSYASYLLGTVDSASLNDNTNAQETGGRWRNYAFYVQDDWSLTPKLKVNLGLRYEIPIPFFEVQNKSSFMNATLPNPEVGNYPGALQFAGNGSDSCNCRTLVQTHHLTLGPRVGFAYSLTNKTVVRGSYTIMHFNSGALGGDSDSAGPGILGYTATPSFTSPNAGITPAFNWNSGFPAYQAAPFFQSTLNTGYNTTTGATGGSVTYTYPAGAGRSPYTENWNVTLQQQVTPATAVSLSYAGSESHLLALLSGFGRYSNQLNPQYLALGSLLTATENASTLAQAQGIIPGIALPYANYQGSIGQMLRPFPQYSAVSDLYSDHGHGHYHSLQAFAQHTMSKGFYIHAAYTWSKEIDDSGGENAYYGDAAAGRNAYNLAIQRSVSADPHHVIAIAYEYLLPFGHGHVLSGNSALLDEIIGGWGLSGSASYSTGANLGPFSASCTLPNAGTCYADYNPSFTGPVRINGHYGSGQPKLSTIQYINVSAFRNPAPYTYGTTPRIAAYGLKGPASQVENVALSKTFSLPEGLKIKLQADAFNVFNRTILGGLNTNITSAAFGSVSTQANTPRQMQIEARVSF